MKMVPENNSKAVYSVAEVISELGLSRARFFQLRNMGVFPEPLSTSTNCHYYSPELRQKCIEIRKTGIGDNGQPTVLYNSRKNKPKGQINL
jgi:predicted DNA-binding transcriptional regulator AlpA